MPPRPKPTNKIKKIKTSVPQGRVKPLTKSDLSKSASAFQSSIHSHQSLVLNKTYQENLLTQPVTDPTVATTSSGSALPPESVLKEKHELIKEYQPIDSSGGSLPIPSAPDSPVDVDPEFLKTEFPGEPVLETVSSETVYLPVPPLASSPFKNEAPLESLPVPSLEYLNEIQTLQDSLQQQASMVETLREEGLQQISPELPPIQQAVGAMQHQLNNQQMEDPNLKLLEGVQVAAAVLPASSVAQKLSTTMLGGLPNLGSKITPLFSKHSAPYEASFSFNLNSRRSATPAHSNDYLGSNDPPNNPPPNDQLQTGWVPDQPHSFALPMLFHAGTTHTTLWSTVLMVLIAASITPIWNQVLATWSALRKYVQNILHPNIQRSRRRLKERSLGLFGEAAVWLLDAMAACLALAFGAKGLNKTANFAGDEIFKLCKTLSKTAVKVTSGGLLFVATSAGCLFLVSFLAKNCSPMLGVVSSRVCGPVCHPIVLFFELTVKCAVGAIMTSFFFFNLRDYFLKLKEMQSVDTFHHLKAFCISCACVLGCYIIFSDHFFQRHFTVQFLKSGQLMFFVNSQLGRLCAIFGMSYILNLSNELMPYSEWFFLMYAMVFRIYSLALIASPNFFPAFKNPFLFKFLLK